MTSFNLHQEGVRSMFIYFKIYHSILYNSIISKNSFDEDIHKMNENLKIFQDFFLKNYQTFNLTNSGFYKCRVDVCVRMYGGILLLYMHVNNENQST